MIMSGTKWMARVLNYVDMCAYLTVMCPKLVTDMKVDNHVIALGNIKLLESMGVDVGELAAKADQLRTDGQTVMLVSIDGQAAGLIGVADPVKESTPEAIQAFASWELLGVLFLLPLAAAFLPV